ncbi:MAG: tetratricopeptide repeat protein [Synechococcales cyanobacterium RU_4_20]|nr:tetratricopeptide repeat protein [Synechococcales cyanobacterium RU_4_20]
MLTNFFKSLVEGSSPMASGQRIARFRQARVVDIAHEVMAEDEGMGGDPIPVGTNRDRPGYVTLIPNLVETDPILPDILPDEVHASADERRFVPTAMDPMIDPIIDPAMDPTIDPMIGLTEIPSTTAVQDTMPQDILLQDAIAQDVIAQDVIAKDVISKDTTSKDVISKDVNDREPQELGQPEDVFAGPGAIAVAESTAVTGSAEKSASPSAATEVIATAFGTTAPDEESLRGEATEVFVRQARAYMQEQDWDKALAACEEALAVAPDIAQAHKRIGNVLQEMGRGIDSMGHYARALLANPRFAEVYANLGSLYARQQAWEDAELYYRKAIALRPDHAVFYRPLAKVLEAGGKAGESAQAMGECLKLEPSLGTGVDHFRAGNVWLERGDEGQAIASYRRAVESEPVCVQAYRPLADLLEKQGDWQGATLYYRKVLEGGVAVDAAMASPASRGIAPSPVAAQPAALKRLPARPITLSELLRQSKQGREHKQQQPVQQPVQQQQAVQPPQPPEEQVVVQASLTAENFARSGQLQAQEKNWERAIEYYQKSLELDARQPGVYRELARALTQAQQLEAAALAWLEAFKLEPDWASAEQWFNLGGTLVKQGKLEQAKLCFRGAVRRDPGFVRGYEHLGRVLELLEDPSGAMVAYRKALEVQGAVSVKK